ncbi:MAG: PDZ domain-containing protein [Planctomycetaceae bacterium]|jgi:membrane-associated protease RseP (regulator of RpoE activity)|nr:PDZ domain-containing protein [Planctomycetaceae bacterium]
MKKVFRLLLVGLTLSVLDVALYAASKDAKPAGEKQDNKPAEVQESADVYWIGVRIAPVPDVFLPQFGISEDDDRGLAVVEQVVPDSPAAKTGLKRGDVILQFGNKDIATLKGLTEQVAAAKGAEQKMVIVRGGKQTEVAIKPEKRPENAAVAQPMQGVQMIPAPGMKMGREFWIGPRDPQEIMKQMEERIRQMQDENGINPFPMLLPQEDKLEDGSSQRLEVFSKTDKDGNASVQVKRYVKKDGKTEEKQWEADSVDKLPEEIRDEVQKTFRGLR